MAKRPSVNSKLIVGSIAVLLMLVFVLQNMEVVGVEFLFWRIQASRIIIYLAIFLIGFFVGWIGRSLHRKRQGGSA